MQGHFNGLTPAELERFAILAEECAEVIQVVGKILRHGMGTDTMFDNRDFLHKELGDLTWILDKMQQEKDISVSELNHYKKLKSVEVKKYLHHN